MRKRLPRPITSLLLLVCACSDQQPTRPDGATGPGLLSPPGQLSDVVPIQGAATPPASMGIGGNALGCFGAGCTPTETATITVNGFTLMYTSLDGVSAGLDFGINAVNGIGAVNAISAVNGGSSAPNGFGLITVLDVPPGVPPTALSVPFTLRLVFQAPLTNPVTVTGTVRGIATGSASAGGLVLTFSDKKTSEGAIAKVDFVQRTTGTAGRMDVSVFSIPIMAGEFGVIPGFFEIR